MNRLSLHSRYAPRESLFAGHPDLYRGDTNAVCSPYLRECVMAMQDCCDEAHETQEILRQGTYDLPRITKVLENERVFLLVDESTIRRYKAELTDEIEPQINELLSRADKGLKALSKREKQLLTKVEGVQLEQTVPSSRSVNTAGMSKLEARRIQMLVRQRERLEDELQTLRMEVDNLELSAMKKR
ncbi:Spc19-domain-containing protein [Cristinia sonorae]|uniref:DASH complex subunit SPC19 n=1 Tax=Cristinia sonorae TaxID=1940300 RepID=A0A8K0XNV3_9AGAR|nr:Spc19-domain-containing protein [Cristinia sonorae]